MDLSGWEEPSPGSIHTPVTDEDWLDVVSRYLNSRNDCPLYRCVDVARQSGARTLVVETRYLDIDFRSEYSTYFSRLFPSVPDSTHRLHFFQKQLTNEQLWNLPPDPGYLGYVVIRPVHNGPISRAMLAPPPDIADAIRTKVTERISFFGQTLEVSGVPFAQQDTQLGVCAHSASWMTYQAAHLRGEVSRRTTAEFSTTANASIGLGRALPSGGLTVLQLSDLFRNFGLPAIYYRLGQLPTDRLPWQTPPPTAPVPPPGGGTPNPGTWDHGIIPVLCWYLNSGFPCLIGTMDHAFVICGYRRVAGQPDWIEFFRNDDQRGPYLPIDDVLNDIDPIWGYHQTPWQTLHVPVPEKIWLVPEAAERSGGVNLTGSSPTVADLLSNQVYGTPVRSLQDLIATGELALKTYVTRSNDFKEKLPSRGLPEELVSAYRLTRMSRFVWVVEAIDRSLRNAGNPCVVGQAVFDATSDDINPRLIGLDVHGVLWTWTPQNEINAPRAGIITGAYASGSAGPP